MKNFSLSHRLSILFGTIAIVLGTGFVNGWNGSINIVSANPNVFKGDRIQTTKTQLTVKIGGNLIPSDPAGLSYPVYQTACRAIQVSLVRGNKVIASTQAAGPKISTGCTYELNTGMLPHLVVAGQFQIVARSPSSGDYGIYGLADINQPVPNQVDLNVSKYSSAPR